MAKIPHFAPVLRSIKTPYTPVASTETFIDAPPEISPTFYSMTQPNYSSEEFDEEEEVGLADVYLSDNTSSKSVIMLTNGEENTPIVGENAA